ncbi:MAG TPA: S8 family serine peptidase [Gaiellaceae bacterium]|nr:S8 family serine peptidase [Gaiellaceae bacterium]
MHVLKHGLPLLVAAAVLVLGTSAAARTPSPAAGGTIELVVRLGAPSLAEATRSNRTLAAATVRRRHLDVRAPASVSYLRTLAAAQRTLASRIVRTIPGSSVRWHYGVVLDGIAVVVPRAEAARLASVPGVAEVYPSVTYHSLLDRSPQLIGAPAMWGPDLATAGQGIKIGIVDEGIDQTHPFFDPAGYTMPAGYPKGNTAYTTAKVIVARAFPPAGTTWKYAGLPFDPEFSEHATHVAGIAAGNNGTAESRTVSVSGIAPKAYLGNYKALTVPTPGDGLDGNSPEIAAAIEAGVRDGMNVLNFSIGEPEMTPKRDVVVDAIEAATAAGVVCVTAAGNDFGDLGNGTVGSPATAPDAIAVAAVTNGRGAPADVIADFSSGGPTPISLQLKPEVSAPGVNVLSSVPAHVGLWDTFSGTSMATPMVSGAAALLLQRHPAWTPAEVKSALVLTGDPAFTSTTRTTEAPTTREGGGVIDIPRANAPLILDSPTTVSFGLVRRSTTVTRPVALTDAGGGSGAWSVSIQQQDPEAGATVTAPVTVTVPGQLQLTATVGSSAAQSDQTGFAVLTQGANVRRIPFWYRVEAPKLGTEPSTPIARPGVYSGNTSGKASLVSEYRYPDAPDGIGVKIHLGGPEQVFRVHSSGTVANFGVAVLTQAPGVTVTPRITYAGDENHLAGYTALPFALNPYQTDFYALEPVASVTLPSAGDYEVVFDTPTGAKPGKFTFRYWVNDKTPPAVALVGSTATAAAGLRLKVTDTGSGVDPSTLVATVDGKKRGIVYAAGRAVVTLKGLAAGTHRVTVVASDVQESKNNENTGPVLPNTTTFGATFRTTR